MGFGRSKKDGDDLDSKKASLFGGRSSNSSKTKISAPTQTGNPYAQPQSQGNVNPYANANVANDPYAPSTNNDPYGRMSSNGRSSAAPPAYDNNGGYPRREDKSAVPQGGYGNGTGNGARYQASSPYSNGSGYGSDAYGSSSQQSRYGSGGYGGLGRANSQETVSTDAGRNALFGDAAQRATQRQAEQPQDSSYSNSSAYGSSGYGSGGYGTSDTSGGYGDSSQQELTAEEQEEQDVQAAKQEIRFIKQQDVASTRNARRIAEQSEALGRETLARLGQQGERIHNTERNLDLASSQNRLAEEKARELKTLNRSMFAVHVANPFTAKKREEAAIAIALDKQQRERAINEATRSEAYSSASRQQQQQRDLNGKIMRPAGRNLAERAKYQFEADSEDEDMENEIDDNLAAIGRGVSNLHMVGKAMGDEIASQNKHLERITKKTDKVDDQIAVNRARLDRIR